MLQVIGGRRVNVVDEGEGPAILFLHGLGGCWLDWEAQFDALSGQFRCVAVDHRGHGWSDRFDGDVSVDDFASDAVSVCAALGIERLAVVGLSMGGVIALTLALDRPDLVEALVVADCSARMVLPTQLLLRRAASRIRKRGMEAVAEMYLKETGRRLGDGDEKSVRMQREWRRFASNDPACFAASLGALTRFDAMARLPSLQVPTLVMRGQHDELVSADDAAALANAIPGARFVTIDGAEHVANRDRPEVFNEELRTFLASTSVRSGGNDALEAARVPVAGPSGRVRVRRRPGRVLHTRSVS